MPTNLQIRARVRKLLEAIDASAQGDDEQCTMNQQRELLVALGSSQYGETVRAGRAFYTGTVTPVAAVAAIPTTACAMALYNNDADGGRSLVIDWVGFQCAVATTTLGQQAQMICLLGQLRETAPTDAALAIKKANGLGSGTNDSKVRTIVSATALPATTTGIAANWFPVGQNTVKPALTATTATVGWGGYTELNGRFIVPPGRYFALHVLADTTTPTFNTFVGWHEKQVQLG
jgi:hypothetical protein